MTSFQFICRIEEDSYIVSLEIEMYCWYVSSSLRCNSRHHMRRARIYVLSSLIMVIVMDAYAWHHAWSLASDCSFVPCTWAEMMYSYLHVLYSAAFICVWMMAPRLISTGQRLTTISSRIVRSGKCHAENIFQRILSREWEQLWEIVKD